MLLQELVELVKFIKESKSESNQIEIKSAYEGCPKIYDTLSSFSNQTGGGTIVFGVDERNDYEVCGVYDAADLQKKIDEQCLQMEPTVRPLCTVAVIDGKTVVSAEIAEIGIQLRPCFYKGKGIIQGSYIRSGDADRKMTEYEIYSYEAFRKKTQDELRHTERASLKDIETIYLDEYMVQLNHQKNNLAKLSTEKKLELQGFVVVDKPTLAGTILFSEYPQSFYPRLCITAVVVPGTEIGAVGSLGERFIDNVTIDGTLPQMLDAALNFVRRNMKTTTSIDRNTGLRVDRPEYPVTAIREILLNALIHRDYSIHTETSPITVIMYKNRIEVENPGGLYGRLTIDTLGTISADTRNPFIAGAMEIMKMTENRFSGIPTIRREMKLLGLPEPVFSNNRGVFKAILNNGTDDLTSSTSLEEQIVFFCNQPRSRDELANRFSNITRTYLFTNYINPLVENGKILLSLPQTPKSKKQKYIAK